MQIIDKRKCEEKVNNEQLTWEWDVTWVVVIRELCMQDGQFLRQRIAIPITYKARKL
jgi:hypothetical protein